MQIDYSIAVFSMVPDEYVINVKLYLVNDPDIVICVKKLTHSADTFICLNLVGSTEHYNFSHFLDA